jgi:hypothetical protein
MSNDRTYRLWRRAKGRSRDDAGRIHQPILTVDGGESAPVFHEIHELVQSWFSMPSRLLFQGPNHMLQAVEPRALAEVLTSFWKQGAHALSPQSQDVPQHSSAAPYRR